MKEREEFMVLEVGCGCHRQKMSSVAVDIKKEGCDVQADATFLPFQNYVFDSCLMFEVLEHVYCPFEVLKEIWRVLKQSGMLTLSIPNDMYYRKFVRWIFKQANDVSPEHISLWSIAEIRNLLGMTGFSIADVSFCTWPQHQKPSRFRRVLPRIFEHSLMVTTRKKMY